MTLQLLINGTDYTARWRLYESRWSSKAWLGESVQADFLIDDFDGAVSHDDLKPRKIVEVWEDASGSPVCLYHGRIANKTLGMGPPNYRIAMQWHVLTEDFNIELRGLRVESQTRGDETDDERFEFFRDGWLSGSGSANANARDSTDLGNAYIGVTPANAVDLDPEQYVDTFPADVFQRIAEQSGRQFFVYLEDDGTGELFYDNRGSQNIVADISITDDGEADDADGVDVFAAYKTPNAGDHAGQEVYTGGAIRYGDDGAYFEASDVGGSESEYDKWETTWSNDWVENDSQASVILGRIITNHDETISYAATIDMRPEDAHRIKAGMWIPSVRLRRANKNGTDGIRAVTVTHEPVKPNADGESWYRVTIEMGRPQFSGPMPRGRRRIPRAPTTTTGTSSARLYFSGDVGAGVETIDAAWATATSPQLNYQLRDTPGGSQTTQANDSVNLPLDVYIDTQFSMLIGSGDLLEALQSGGTFRAQIRGNSRHGIGINEGLQDHRLNAGARVFRGGSVIGTAIAVNTIEATSTYPPIDNMTNKSISAAFTAVPGALSTDKLVVEIGWTHYGPASGGTGVAFKYQPLVSAGSDLPEDEVTTSDLRSWIEFRSSGGSTVTTHQTTVRQGDGTFGDDGVYVPAGSTVEAGLLSEDGEHYFNASDIEYDPTTSGMSASDVQSAIDELAVGATTADVVDHGAMGATETFDFTDGTNHEGEQDANLTVTLAGAVDTEAAWMTLVLTQDGGGGNTLTLPASVAGASDIEAAWDLTPAATNILTLFSYDGGVIWYGFLSGGSGVELSDATPLVESGAGDAGVGTEASRDDHVHPAAAGGGGVPNAILLESGSSVPFTFDEILQESDGSDFLWASE